MKKWSISGAIVLLTLLFSASSYPQTIDSSKEQESVRTPVATTNCISYYPSGRCREYEYIYAVQGATCVADCVVFDSFDQCVLRNRCLYDQKSGCFIKSVCREIGTLKRCKEWDSEVYCGN